MIKGTAKRIPPTAIKIIGKLLAKEKPDFDSSEDSEEIEMDKTEPVIVGGVSVGKTISGVLTGARVIVGGGGVLVGVGVEVGDGRLVGVGVGVLVIVGASEGGT